MAKLYVVGDSTVAKFNDTTYFYPRYGYGELLNDYFNIEVINLALSGRSSISFTYEDNYKKLIESISLGDYVLIGFGHNDEKFDDSFRFTDARFDVENPKSFKHVLYYYYIKKIIEVGATPILTTPIVRLDPKELYQNETIHQTTTGDYRKAIIDLCDSLNLLSIDLTKYSLDFAIEKGYEYVLPYHAMTKGKMINNELTYDPKSVDKTHLSYIGAKMSAYYIALNIKNSDLGLKKYLKEELKFPTLDELKPNDAYIYKEYKTPDLDNYKPIDNFKCKEFYGTAFGTLDNINFKENGFVAKEEDGKYIVGQSGDKCHGRINASTEGYSFLFRRINKEDNFIFEANCKILKEESIRQAGFGLMLRGDSYLNQNVANSSICTNYIASGLLTTDKVTFTAFARPSTTDLERYSPVGERFYESKEEVFFRIERIGQVVKTKCIYLGNEYNNVFTDFDYYYDNKYLFVGMFGTNGTLVEFFNIKFEITGKAIEA